MKYMWYALMYLLQIKIEEKINLLYSWNSICKKSKKYWIEAIEGKTGDVIFFFKILSYRKLRDNCICYTDCKRWKFVTYANNKINIVITVVTSITYAMDLFSSEKIYIKMHLVWFGYFCSFQTFIDYLYKTEK